MKTVSIDQLSRNDRGLLETAMRLRANAWAHYSGHKVGVVIVSDTGRTYKGVNVECAVNPDGITASKVALGSLVAAGERTLDTWVAVGPGELVCYPAGGDLQLALEFATRDSRILCSNQDGTHVNLYSFTDLLPHAFDFKNIVAVQKIDAADDEPARDQMAEQPAEPALA